MGINREFLSFERTCGKAMDNLNWIHQCQQYFNQQITHSFTTLIHHLPTLRRFYISGVGEFLRSDNNKIIFMIFLKEKYEKEVH